MGLYNKISDIRALVFYIQSIESDEVVSYEFWDTPSKNAHVKWADNVFTISHVNQGLLRHVREKFLSLQKNSYQ